MNQTEVDIKRLNNIISRRIRGAVVHISTLKGDIPFHVLGSLEKAYALHKKISSEETQDLDVKYKK